MTAPVPTDVHSYVDKNGKPSKPFFDWLKKLRDDSTAVQNLVNLIVSDLTVPVAFAALPSPLVAGQRRLINDAGPPYTFGGAASGGGGAVIGPVYSDGTIWRYG